MISMAPITSYITAVLNNFLRPAIIFAGVLLFSNNSNAQIGIGVPAGEDPQATLDVRFDSAVSPGFLMPRVTNFPSGDVAEGMLVYYHGSDRDTTYYVYIDGEWRPLAETAGIAPPDTEAPTAPSSLTASNPSSSTIDLSWTASTDNVGVSGYYIYYSDGTLATTASGTSVTVTGLDASTTYTFYATAYDAAGNESTASNMASETTTAVSCEALTFCETSFEMDLGCWTVAWSNGNYWYSSENVHDGSYSLKITNLGAVTAPATDFSGYASVDISFWYLTDGYGNQGGFSDSIILQYRNDGGTWLTLQSYNKNESRHGTFVEATYNLSGASYMTANSEIRILAYANNGNDILYLDLTSMTANCP
jgi:hypothetical protein